MQILQQFKIYIWFVEDGFHSKDYKPQQLFFYVIRERSTSNLMHGFHQA